MNEFKKIFGGTEQPMTDEKFDELKKAIEKSKEQTRKDLQVDSHILSLKINT